MAASASATPRIKVVQYSFICYRLAARGLSQADVARAIGCAPETLNLVIQGKRSSSRVQDALAMVLGYRNWTELDRAAAYWDWNVRSLERGWEVANA